jgi:hypothetical protein
VVPGKSGIATRSFSRSAAPHTAVSPASASSSVASLAPPSLFLSVLARCISAGRVRGLPYTSIALWLSRRAKNGESGRAESDLDGAEADPDDTRSTPPARGLLPGATAARDRVAEVHEVVHRAIQASGSNALILRRELQPCVSVLVRILVRILVSS